MKPPKPIPEDTKVPIKEGAKSNIITTVLESDVDPSTKPIPEPFPVEPQSQAITSKKTRKRKETKGKDPDTHNTTN